MTLIQFSPIAIIARVKTRRRGAIGSNTLTTANINNGVDQKIVLIVKPANTRTPRKLRLNAVNGPLVERAERAF